MLPFGRALSVKTLTTILAQHTQIITLLYKQFNTFKIKLNLGDSLLTGRSPESAIHHKTVLPIDMTSWSVALVSPLTRLTEVLEKASSRLLSACIVRYRFLASVTDWRGKSPLPGSLYLLLHLFMHLCQMFPTQGVCPQEEWHPLAGQIMPPFSHKGLRSSSAKYFASINIFWRIDISRFNCCPSSCLNR